MLLLVSNIKNGECVIMMNGPNMYAKLHAILVIDRLAIVNATEIINIFY